MKDLAKELTETVNEYIAKGLTTEEICGCLEVVKFRVMQASILPAEAESGGGSPVSYLREGPPFAISSSPSPSPEIPEEV